MNNPDFEHYHKIKHKLEAEIERLYETDNTRDSASDARSQLLALESFVEQQFKALVYHARSQAYHIESTLKTVANTKQDA